MNTARKKAGLVLVLIALVAGAAVSGWHLYRWWKRPDFRKRGGTVLIYELDMHTLLPGSDWAKDLPDTLTRRLDPSGVAGITVRLIGDRRVEIAIPRGGDHEEYVSQVKDLIAQCGVLEFRILANPRDDAEAIECAGDYLKSAENAVELRRLAMIGDPPPPPRAKDGGDTFPVTLQGETANHGYSWVEVGKEEIYTLHLYNDAEKSPTHGPQWQAVAAARDKSQALLFPIGQKSSLLYSRTIPNSDRLSPREREQGKKYEFFLLTRNPEPGKVIAGTYISAVEPGKNERGDPIVRFRLKATGANHFHELTSRNKPSAEDGGFERQLAIILDNQIRSATALRNPMRDRVEISGGFTQERVDELVIILRAGDLPVLLKPVPLSEITVGPME